jgi:tetratricopeptide (TPR) repeat protein
MFKINSFLVILTTLLMGCASQGVKDPTQMSVSEARQLTPEQLRKANEDAMSRVSDQLGQLVDIAKKSSPEKQVFLANDMYLKASAAMMEGDYFTANIILEQLIKLDPKEDYLKRKYAVSLIRTGELEKSKSYLEEIYTNSKKKDAEVGLVLAGVYSSLGDTKKSVGIYKHILKREPKNEDACVFLGKLYALDKKFNTAVKTLKRCEKRHPKNGIFSYNIGKLYIDKEQLKKSQIYFEKALKRQPDYAQAAMALGIVLEERGHFKSAIKVYKKFLGDHPNNILILNRIVQAMFVLEQHDKVIPYALRLSDLESDNLNLKVKLGILYTENNKYDKALSIFKDILIQAPKSDKILYYIGAIYQEKLDFEKSIEHFQKIQQDSPLYADSSIQIANMLSTLAKEDFYLTGKIKQKHMNFVRYTRDRLDDLPKLKVEISVIMASYYESVKLKSEALDVLTDVKDEVAFGDNHKYYLASLYEANGDFSESVDIMMELVEKDPKNAHAWNFLGYSLLERGEDMDKAYSYIKKAVDLSPKDGYILDSLGWYYYKTGNTKKALSKLLAAHKIVPDETSILKHLAEVYLKMQKPDDAKKFLKTAIQNTPSPDDKKRLEKALEDIESGRLPASF